MHLGITITVTVLFIAHNAMKQNVFRCRSALSHISTKMSNDMTVSIEDRTNSCLDFEVVVDSVKSNCVTVLGREMFKSRKYSQVIDINHAYMMVDELSFHLDFLPLRSKMDVSGVIRTIELGGAPEREDIQKFSEIIEEISELRTFLEENLKSLTLYVDLAHQMILPEEFVLAFEKAFDDEGNLSGEKYPILKRLRVDQELLKLRIIQTIQNILRSPAMKDKIADSGYTDLEGRYCLLLFNTFKKGVGIVHGTSNTGRTVYVEPFEIVEPTNEMKSLAETIKAEENKILYEMCRMIATHREAIKTALFAVADVDIMRARAKLGRTMKGTIPEVSDEGVFRCSDARHPVLCIRGTNSVGNNLHLNSSATALVISGPNAGGKTVVLKTAGLYCLMVRHAIPIPARPGARVDLMNVMADIGDMQTVSGDLSTFSGHLVVCREMLRSAQGYSGSSLVLLDEIGTGTDPAQGAALAQAVLEELIDIGARVIVTTHYQRIKELAAEDARFAIAAMEFVDNKPTYRLRLGSVGESYALEAGRRMGLPEHVLSRANLLLDDESRRILALQQRLEEETDRARQRQQEFARKIEELAGREDELIRDRDVLATEIEKVRSGATEQFLVELRAKEQELEQMLRKAQEAMLMAELSKKEKEKVVEEVKASMKSVRTETETTLIQQTAEDIALPLPAGEPIEEGAILIILERGTLFGSRGVVTRRNKGRGRVQIRVAGAEVKIERHLLGLPKSSKFTLMSDPSQASESDLAEMSAKDRRMMKILQEELVDPDQLLAGSRKLSPKKSGASRSSKNTLDIRGVNIDDAQEQTASYIQTYVNKVETSDAGVLYIHHGNKKEGDLVKPKLRSWLKRHVLVKSVGPAMLSEGGDAYTVVELSLEDDD